jgi:hypothetical protein
MTGAMPTAGFSQLSCRVMSVQNDMATVRDQLNRQIDVRRDIARAKGGLPQVGEQWIISRDLLGDWTFAAIIGLSTAIPPTAPDIVYEVASAAERDAIDPAFRYLGMTVFRRDVGYHEIWDGSSWSSAPRLGVIKHIDPTTDLPFSSGTTTVDTPCQITINKVAGREYKFCYVTRYSQTTAGGTLTVAFRYVAGNGPIATTSTLFGTTSGLANGANNAFISYQKYLPLSLAAGTYTIGVTLFTGSGGGSSIVYGGTSGEGRMFEAEDKGISQQ